MKKIGILTLPTWSNYGGILQTYALVYTLRKLGYDAWYIYRRWNSEQTTLFHKTKKIIYHSCIARKFDCFVQKYIVPQTPIIDSRQKMNQIRNRGFDAYVVGSDQVWRIKDVRGADYNYFLDFAQDDNVQRISYAASFGVDYWDDNQDASKSIEEVKPLLEKFDAISVREDSGIKVCMDCFGLSAVNVLDPTLLVEKKEYIANFKLKNAPKKYIAVYILDMTPEKAEMVSKVSKALKLPVKYIDKPIRMLRFVPASITEMVKPGVKSWMQSILNAQFVLTDSFHGMAYSINFEKQFLVIGNKRRGLTRFTSLLSQLNLMDRLIVDTSFYKAGMLETKIDFSKVQPLKQKLQKISIDFIVKHIK